MPSVQLLDYVAGNIRSLVNAIEKLGYEIEWIKNPEDVQHAQKLIVPGVGHFGHCLTEISKGGYSDALRKYINAGKPFLGICVGLQALFEGSEENPAVSGLGIVPGQLKKFSDSSKAVPHIGWNSARPVIPGGHKRFYGLNPNSKYYYVHSYAVPYEPGALEKDGWNVATAKYGDEEFIGAIWRGNTVATQFHPEKSGQAGLKVIEAFLTGDAIHITRHQIEVNVDTGLTRRIIACLDVRTNDAGDLVVTKGDQYDVREKVSNATSEKEEAKGQGGQVRNLGKPIDVAKRYYHQGADEITFLNITSFRNCPLQDLPMLEILRRASETIFVPLTVGGGIKDTTDTDGTVVSARQVAQMYFQSGADKVSIGGDAVLAAEEYYAAGEQLSGTSSIEQISRAYGNQAVVVSVDPRRVYVDDASDTNHNVIPTKVPDTQGRKHIWYQCTIHGGRSRRDLDVIQLVRAVEAMGAGEILLNCIDRDGTNSGFDLELIHSVKSAVAIPVIASSGAGNPDHFRQVFEETTTDAALGAGMFHRNEYTVAQVKEVLAQKGLLIRPVEEDQEHE